MVDCDSKENGCDGGVPMFALNYIKDNGIAFYNDYPYTSGSTHEATTCISSTLTMNKVIENVESCKRKQCSRSQLRLLLAKGPLVVTMDGDGGSQGHSILQHYKSGVLENMVCVKVSHAVVMIGNDTDEKGEYLIVRNSWGSSWGENGNFRIRTRDSDKTCFLEESGLLPIVKQTFNPVPPPIQPGCMKLFSECKFKGKSKEICNNTKNIDNFPLINGYSIGKFSSIKLFYQNQNCVGKFSSLKSDLVCLDNVSFLKNSIKSVIVEETIPPSGCVWLYDDNCLSGNKVEICKNVSDLNDIKFNFGNKTSSFKLGPGVASLTIYLDRNYKGSYASITKDIYGLEGNWMNKEIESIKIELIK